MFVLVFFAISPFVSNNVCIFHVVWFFQSWSEAGLSRRRDILSKAIKQFLGNLLIPSSKEKNDRQTDRQTDLTAWDR